jgi:magnesium-transporting ATPase (P-type)
MEAKNALSSPVDSISLGFALGVACTEIAKEACVIVILDRNIQSIAVAVLRGLNEYEGMRKFICAPFTAYTRTTPNELTSNIAPLIYSLKDRL